jgi:hypothetical protein
LAKRKNGNTKNDATTADLGFEAKLWAAADALRNNMDAAEYLFLNYLGALKQDKAIEAELDGSPERSVGRTAASNIKAVKEQNT